MSSSLLVSWEQRTIHMDHKSYCPSCGRDLAHDYACLHQVKLTKLEVMIIYLMVILFPILLIPNDVLISPWGWDSFLPSTALALMGILIILTLLNLIFNRPYLALFFGCHQKRERSPLFFHRVWVLCVRCSGIYLGILMMMISYFIIFPWWLYLLLSLPLLIDGILQQKNILNSNGPRRLITGLLFGFSLVFMVNLMIYGMMLLSSWIVSLL